MMAFCPIFLCLYSGKDVMSQFIKEKLVVYCTIKDPHMYMSHWNLTQEIQ